MEPTMTEQEQFVTWMAERLAQEAQDGEDWTKHAQDVLNGFLEDEKIEFGDPNHVWDRDAARELAYDYDIAYWEG